LTAVNLRPVPAGGNHAEAAPDPARALDAELGDLPPGNADRPYRPAVGQPVIVGDQAASHDRYHKAQQSSGHQGARNRPQVNKCPPAEERRHRHHEGSSPAPLRRDEPNGWQPRPPGGDFRQPCRTVSHAGGASRVPVMPKECQAGKAGTLLNWSPDLHYLLTGEMGWSAAQHQQWVTGLREAGLLTGRIARGRPGHSRRPAPRVAGCPHERV